MFYVYDCPYNDSSAVGERQWRSIDDRAVVNPISWPHRFRQDLLLVEGVAACASLYPIISGHAGAPWQRCSRTPEKPVLARINSCWPNN